MLQLQIGSHIFLCLSKKKDTVKLANVNMGHAQGVGIFLCHFPKCSIIYLLGPVYYYLVHLSNTI